MIATSGSSSRTTDASAPRSSRSECTLYVTTRRLVPTTVEPSEVMQIWGATRLHRPHLAGQTAVGGLLDHGGDEFRVQQRDVPEQFTPPVEHGRVHKRRAHRIDRD